MFACVGLPWRGGPHTSAELTNDSRSSMGKQQVAFPLPDGSHSYKERRASAPIQRAGDGGDKQCTAHVSDTTSTVAGTPGRDSSTVTKLQPPKYQIVAGSTKHRQF